MANLTSEILDRLPPSDLDSEKAVLCSILLDPTYMHEVAPLVTPTDFYAAAHQAIYAAMLELQRHEGAIDPVTLAEHLKRTGDYEAIGGVTYLLEIARAVAVAGHAAHYAGIVRAKSRARQVVHAATELLRNAYDPTFDVDELLAKAEKAIAILRDSATEDRAYTAHEAGSEAVRLVEEMRRQSRSRGVMTGLLGFDAAAGGFFSGELTILAARPGIGKTSLAQQIAYHNAARGRPVLFCSLEMGKAELATWQLCAIAGVPRLAIRNNSASDEEVSLFTEANQIFGNSKLLIYERPGMGVSDIRRLSRKHKREGLALVCVDYLQLVKPDDRKAPREQQVASIAHELKSIARELEVPVLCLCQLNRQAEQGEEPKLSHLRESGAIEQDADGVLFLWRTSDGTKLGVAKNRATGDLGTFDLRWVAMESRYESVQPQNHEHGFDEFAGRRDGF